MSNKLRLRRLGAALSLLGSAGALCVTAGCSTAPQRQAKPKDPAIQKVAMTVETPVGDPEEQDQADAQRVWCEYLEALYQRATGEGASWPNKAECLAAQTLAAPEMLRRTAICSRAALERFAGDPFTRAYAAEVSRCGSSALDAVEADGAALAPYVAAICGSMSRCGESTYEACQREFGEGFAPNLERAVGAMNRRGRANFEVCLSKLRCGDVGSQVVGCLEPIMNGLLWLPG